MSSQNKKKKYNPAEDADYALSRQKLESLREQRPVYDGKAAETAAALSQQIQQRPAFSYDINTDALYQQYSRQYQDLGRGAMEDTMGIAQAMTGGYGNSYAQTAGQQSYQKYLSQLGDKLPQLYQQALQRYTAEGDWLQNRYDTARDQEQTEYARYQDALDSYNRDLSFLQTQMDAAYDRGYQQYLDNYNQQQDLYQQVLYLMEKRGYHPTEDALVELGLTPEQAKLLLGKL